MSPPPPFDGRTLLAHRDFLCSLARSLLGDEQRAEDVVQDACIVALERPPHSAASLRAWMARVVRNLALKRAAREAERPARERAATPDERVAGTEANASFELHQRVAGALRALPEPYKTTVYLRFYEDLGPRDIARRQRASVDTVKTRLRRGLALLRADLDAAYGGERKLWCLPLASLLGPAWGPTPVPAPSAAPAALGGTTALGGLLVMKTLGIVLASLTAVVAVVLVAAQSRDDTSPAEASAAPVGSSGLAAPATLAGDSIVPAAAETERVAVDSAAPPERTARAAGATSVGRVRVVDADDAPIADALVSFAREPGVRRATGADGSAALELAAFDPRDVERTLVLESAGFLTLRRTVTLADAPEVQLGTFVMVRGATIRGSVLDAAGVGVRDATVLASEPGEAFWPSVAQLPARRDFTTRTDERGDFELRDVPAGAIRLWAGANGLVDGCSPVLTIAAGTELSDVVIGLEAAVGTSEIAGRVRLPDGAEDPGLLVFYSYVSDEGRRTRTTTAGEGGRFRIQLEEPVPHELWARESPTGWDERKQVYTGARALAGHRGVVADAVPPGTSDVVLTFEPAPSVDLIVSAASGRAIDPFTLGVVEYSGDDLGYEVASFRQVSSPVVLPVPTCRFWVSVFADRFERVDLGPFDSADVPNPILVELRAIPDVKGRVLAGGRPISGATIELFQPSSRRHITMSRGFLLRMNAVAAAEALSAADGDFRMTVRSSGAYYARAVAPGWAPAEIGPIEIDHEAGMDGLDFELTKGGAIEGRVLASPDADPTGWVIGASNGDPYGHTFVTGPDGRFRFTGLQPGEWLVERVTRHDKGNSIRSSREPVVWTGNTKVVEGQTTRFDLEAESGDECIVHGWLEVDGVESFSGWTATLTPADEDMGHGADVDSVPLSAEGSFEMIAPEPGTYRMLIDGRNHGRNGVIAMRVLELREPIHQWSEHIRTGTLEALIEDEQASASPMLVYLVEDGRGLTATRLRADADGVFSSALAPEGRGRIRYATPETAELPPLEWPLLGEVEVTAGRTATFEDEGD